MLFPLSNLSDPKILGSATLHHKKKLDAYLRSPGLSGGSALSFLCLYLPKFFYAIIDFSCNCFFSWYARDAGFSHMYTELKTAFVM